MCWIIVDDGSIDNTIEIVKSYCENYGWITLLENDNKEEKRSGGVKVVRAFYKGYNFIQDKFEFDFIVKLDGDLTLPKDYFEKISLAFSSDNKIGICGGYILNDFHGELIEEKRNSYHVRGAFKALRKKCFLEIGGFKQVWNWDGLDEMMAIYIGWETKVLDIPVIHHRPTTQAYNKVWHNFKSGIDAYQSRNNLVILFLRAINRFFYKPLVIGSFAYLFGYFYAFLKRKERYVDKGLGSFINSYHMKHYIKQLLNS